MPAPIIEQQLSDFPQLAGARSLWAAGRLAEALDAFEQAIRTQPDNLKALLEAARAYGQYHHATRAQDLLDRAWSVASHDPRVAPLIAQSYARCFREHIAIEKLEALSPGLPAPMLGELAVLYERVNRLSEALQTIDACIDVAPSAPEPRLVRARVLRRMGRLDDALAALGPLAEGPHVPALRAEAWTELCYIHDSCDRHEAAVEAIEQAHAIMAAQPHTKDMLRRARANNAALTALSESWTSADLAGYRQMPEPLPGGVAGAAHLIGFPRSGTTLLEQCLAAHPRLADSPERVVFTRDILPEMCRAGGGPITPATLDAVPPGALAGARERYFSAMADALGQSLEGMVHLDKNPNHTALLPGLLRLLPESRLIVAIRDPRDVIVSCVLRSFRPTEFSAMLLQWGTACELYAVEMGAWLRYRPHLDEQTWVQVRYEDTVTQTTAQTRRALQTLDLEWHEAMLDYRDQAKHKLVNSPTQTEVRQPVYTRSVGRWRRYERYLKPHLPLLEPFIKAFGYD